MIRGGSSQLFLSLANISRDVNLEIDLTNILDGFSFPLGRKLEKKKPEESEESYVTKMS